MLSLIAIISSMTAVVETKDSMIIMWGYPIGKSHSFILPAEDWESCIRYCQNDFDCVLVYSDNKFNTTDCNIYFFDMIANVQLTDVSDGMEEIVALKVNPNQCFKVQTKHFPATGYTPTGTYSVSLMSSDNTMRIKYQYNIDCFKGVGNWVTVWRDDGLYCMQLYPDPDTGTTMSRNESIVKCESYENSDLAGIASHFESMIFSNRLGERYAWVDGERKCIGKDGKPTCDVFEFSNKTIQGSFNDTLFFPGFPKKGTSAAKSNCLILDPNLSGDGSQNIRPDKCQSTQGGFVCGWKLA